MKRYIYLLSKRDRFKTAPSISFEFNLNRNGKCKVSAATVRRALKKQNLLGRVAVKKPLISKKNIKLRYQWAKRHENWSKQDFYTVMYSDESIYKIFGPGNRRTW